MKLEKVCRELQFGELEVILKVKKGKVYLALVKKEWTAIKEDPPTEDLLS